MNILLINGSPKGERSNTLQLSGAFIAGLGEHSIRQLNVSKLKIHPCLGCFSCWNKTPGHCCLNDDMATVIESLLWADITVWSFPLYYYNVPGPLKNLIDRQLPMVLPFMSQEVESGSHPSRFNSSAKRHIVISTCGFHTAKGNYDGVLSLFDHLCGKGNYETVFCGQGELFRVPELKERTRQYLSIVEQAGREYIAGGISESTRSQLEQPLYPRAVFEAMADASWGVDRNTGKQSDETEVFTRQMAALYNPESWSGKDLVLEMHYTDEQKTFQILMEQRGSQVLTADFKEFTTRIETPFTVWKAIASGEISGEAALAQQKYRVLGNFDLLLHWDNYFGIPGTKQQDNSVEKTNMYVMLLPWMAFWIAGGIDSTWGSIIALLTCGLTPLVFLKTRKTVYDLLSGALVTVFAVGLLMPLNPGIVIPLSYLAFGLLWTISCFTAIPLSAHYSMYGYGGDAALKNPLFIKTNRILSLAWGFLYLLTTVWTFFIMKTWLSAYVALINGAAPIAMGIFTGWFQKWYPAKVARGDK